MKVCRSTHPMDNSVYCILVTHYYIVGSGRSNSSALRKRGLGLPTSYGDGLGSRVALHIFPDCCFRQGIEAQSVALAVEPYRREFLLPKHGDDPIQRNTARAPDKFVVHESMWPDLFGKWRSLGNSADWTVVRYYYIDTIS